jgi:hypothetical protein
VKLTLPSAAYLRSLGWRGFESERALQHLFEDRICPTMNLSIVASSTAGGRGLGGIDTVATTSNGTLAIIEYKLDVIDNATIAQVLRYRNWVLDHRAKIDRRLDSLRPGLRLNGSDLLVILVGYVYHQAFKLQDLYTTQLVGLRYGYAEEDHTLLLHQIIPGDRITYGDGRAPKFSKRERTLAKHGAKTTDAGRKAFDVLSAQLQKRGLAESFPGKNRIWYKKNGHLLAEAVFTTTGLELLFESPPSLIDPEGRVGRSGKDRLDSVVAVSAPGDVDYAVKAVEGRIVASRA